MKVDIIFYDRKTQKETGKKEFGLLWLWRLEMIRV